jgi:hypothetical protein
MEIFLPNYNRHFTHFLPSGYIFSLTINSEEKQMFTTSKEFKLAVILTVAAVVVSFGAARIILYSSPETTFERGYGFRSWGDETYSRGYVSPWAGRWGTRYMTETEREVLFENLNVSRPSLSEWVQMFGQELQTFGETSPAALILLGISSLGILALCVFGLLWLNKLAERINAICEGDGKKTAGAVKFLLLGIITFGIYNLLWLYMLGERLQDNARRYNLSFKEGGGIILLWFVPGMFILVGPFIALYIVIKNTNVLAVAYNKGTV